jgi:hypothetical protein
VPFPTSWFDGVHAEPVSNAIVRVNNSALIR